jgi:hypothetical protein
LKIHYIVDFQALTCGVGRDRTADTRIFSPLLYRLSYRTSFSEALVKEDLVLEKSPLQKLRNFPFPQKLGKWKPSLAFVFRGCKYRGNSQEIHKKSRVKLIFLDFPFQPTGMNARTIPFPAKVDC